MANRQIAEFLRLIAENPLEAKALEEAVSCDVDAPDPDTLTSPDTPLVSIGLTVFNAAEFLPRTFSSILAFDYPKLEILISDNASSDRSEKICREFAARDSRIRYYRNNMNIGAPPNFNQVFLQSTGKYFMWAADHDHWDPGFVRRCVALMEEDPQVVLCCSDTGLLGPQGEVQGIYLPEDMDTRGLSPEGRFAKLLRNFQSGNIVYGVIRAEALRKTGLLPKVQGTDIVLLAELSLMGTIAKINECLYFRRDNHPGETPIGSVRRWAADFFDERRKLAAPFASMGHELNQVIRNSTLPDAAKELLLAEVCELLRGRYATQMEVEIKNLVDWADHVLRSFPNNPRLFRAYVGEVLHALQICNLFFPEVKELWTRTVLCFSRLTSARIPPP